MESSTICKPLVGYDGGRPGRLRSPTSTRIIGTGGDNVITRLGVHQSGPEPSMSGPV